MPYSVFVLAHYFNPTPITVRLIAPKRFPGQNQLFQPSHTATQHVSPLPSTFFFFVTLDGGGKALHSMSAPAGSRLVLRHSRFVIRLHGRVRNASTTSDAAQAASDTAAKSKKTVSNISSKASEGLSRVTSSAGPALNGAAQRVNGVLSRVGGRTGRLISFTRSLIPPTIYYSKVGFELSKIVFRGQKMSPPSLDVFQSYFSSLVNIIRHPTAFLSTAENTANSVTLNGILGRIRNVSRQQLVSAGVISAEVLGFFTVGEMIGRLKLVGYRGDVEHH